MYRTILAMPLLMLLYIVALPAETAAGDDSAAVTAQFAHPPRQYSSAPLWIWNDMLTDQQVIDTLRDLAAQKVKQAFVHPRPGLMTPYLGPEWFRLWKVALAEAERLDMNLWIYDENSYPSGFAGGWVPELMPESRGRGLRLREVKQIPPSISDDNLLAVFRLTDSAAENVTQQARSGEPLPEGKYLMATVQRAANSPWTGNRCYVDLLYPGVTEKFLEVTLEAYRRELGNQFGKRIPGSFTDEPHLFPAGGLPWSDHLPEEFQRRWGYSLVDNLASLHGPVGDWRRVRHDYFQVVLEQFIEHWSKPYHDYCEKNGLELTGHYYGDHQWPECLSVPDDMAMYAWHHRPAIDCLENQYREKTDAQFGNLRMVKELSSVANQLGMHRTLCEAYGAGGWDLRFEDMKRIGDWLHVLGVNTLCQHLSYITIRGARKRDHPQSFSYHEPWWEDYHVMAEYFSRLSLALSSGEEINSVLVIEPTTTAWMYQPVEHLSSSIPMPAGRLKEIGDQFFDLVLNLSKAQVEYDIGCEDIIARHGAVAEEEEPLGSRKPHDGGGPFLQVGRRKYRAVVLPPLTETVNSKTMEFLEEFAKDGCVISCGPPPALVDGRPSDRGLGLAKRPGWKQVEPAALPAMLLGMKTGSLTIHRADDDRGILFHQRRRLDDGELLFLVNTSIDSPASGIIESTLGGVRRLDLESGAIVSYPFTPAGRSIRADFTLPPCGSLLLLLSNQSRQPTASAPPDRTAVASSSITIVPPAGDLQIRRIEPNVLTLDYVDIAAGGETKKNVYCYRANQFAFQKNGMTANPWDSAVQFKDELITKKFPAESGFKAAYHFTIEGQTPNPLWIVIERPDLYAIACNDKPVLAATDQWWLDKSFGKVDIAAAVQPGENTVTIKAAPMTIYHELEPAYLLGDFTVRPASAGFVIGPPAPLKLGPWNEQGQPMYAAGVAYRQTFDVSDPKGTYRVCLPKWYGSLAKVSVNGHLADHVAYQPWECDVTGLIVAGSNSIEVVVIGTLKNTLGPHHGKPTLGRAWPAMFRVGPEHGPPPGQDYHTVGYGLFEPFVLEQSGN